MSDLRASVRPVGRASAKKGKKQGPNGACRICKLHKTAPERAIALEERLALGDHGRQLAAEYGVDRRGMVRHWELHCNQREILRRAHRQAADAKIRTLLTETSTTPVAMCHRQISIYMQDFQAACARGDREARDAADRHLFAWTKLLHQIQLPLHAQYGPQVNVQNNVVVAGAGADFGALVAQIEQRLALRPRDQRRQFIALLREVATSDREATAGAVIDADAAA
jgi:hypothetical protein